MALLLDGVSKMNPDDAKTVAALKRIAIRIGDENYFKEPEEKAELRFLGLGEFIEIDPVEWDDMGESTAFSARLTAKGTRWIA